jgi:hypothetical protein
MIHGMLCKGSNGQAGINSGIGGYGTSIAYEHVFIMKYPVVFIDNT